ncbi:tRNA (adenosine(37)-N6)-dimethylallyltransferase MiaA [Rubidibacter lacunae]|uniref:tRNA (adenosine(37)-N6)-dimethylallyltransferase MiaA n=1 Tax=Rubidibacter lacunae TaxID=582514 RepID=UPI0018DD6AC0|nr:tRNA (adenosine(37)-N6)-dimethylallyltransferase MiaA [Rubidibacter lacunae]
MPRGAIAICGATATGKSALALAIAERLDTVIVSADSRQVYREFDIGTAKPTLAERDRVRHYLIDICNPTETLTLAQYQERAQAAMSIVPVPLLVGGTGLYIKAIARGLKMPRVPPQPELREQLATFGPQQLHFYLQQVDSAAAQRIHGNDRVRMLRALEVYYATGRPLSAQQGARPPDYPILQIGLHCNAEAVAKRIHHRTEAMLAAGLVDEVRGLVARYGWELPLLDTLGYREIKGYLAGKMTLGAARDAIALHTCQFAKRQRTWFGADKTITWFDAEASDLLDRIWNSISAFVDSSDRL